jgi:uncharacterized protein YjiS (DUF1127 family)
MSNYHQNPGLAAIPSSVWGGAFEEIVIMARSAANAVANGLETLVGAYRHRAALREMKGMDDRLLADIGFIRLPNGDIARIGR